MEITINGKAADITLESEKNLGDFLTGIEQWLERGGHRISGIRLDGEDITADALAGSLDRNLRDIKTIAIKTLGWPELAAEALLYTLEDIKTWQKASFADRDLIRQGWGKSVAAGFLKEQIPDIFAGVEKTLSGEGLSPAAFQRLIEERLRELTDPYGELKNIEPLVTTIAGRLEDLPLDIQTGKDGRTAETLQLFSQVAEKLFRLFYSLKSHGSDVLTIESRSVQNFIEEFGAVLKELMAAYEVKDTVLVGDLAEYELAPRFVSLYTTLKGPITIP
ncbi:MAG: hypothetical protein LBT93_08910 [Treponema sp.]|jgi:hypothetical protein|nr:hypothetical protein [Treponema sp.]